MMRVSVYPLRLGIGIRTIALIAIDVQILPSRLASTDVSTSKPLLPVVLPFCLARG
jgi:hypothetical protein